MQSRVDKFIAIVYITISLLLHVKCERHFLLNYNGTRIETKDHLVANCTKNKDCVVDNGWKYDQGMGGWYFMESSLSTPCCILKNKPVYFPGHTPLPKEIYIDLTVNFSSCTMFGRKCRESLKVKMRKTWNSIEITPGVIPRDESDHRKYKISRNSSLEIKMSALNFYGVVRSVSMYFDFCQQSTNNLVWYPAMRVNETSRCGKCIEHAVNLFGHELNRTCDEKGNSTYVGFCECEQGYMLKNETCTACSENTVKPLPGNTVCQRCPDGSLANQEKTVCQCKYGYRRFNESNEKETCYEEKPCPAEEINLGTLGTYYYPSTNISTFVNVTCVHGSKQTGIEIQRTCSMNETGDSVWQQLDLEVYCLHDCINNTVRLLPGNTVCQRCPDGSLANEEKTVCRCKHGYRRFNESNEKETCYEEKPCPAEEINLGTLGTYYYPSTNISTFVNVTCVHGSKQTGIEIQRTCSMNETGDSVWQQLDLRAYCQHTPCPKEEINNASLGSYIFPETKVNGSVKYNCMYGHKKDVHFELYRRCIVDETTQNSSWTRMDLTSCQELGDDFFEKDLDKINITKENVQYILYSFLMFLQDSTTTGDNRINVSQAVKMLINSMAVAGSEEVFYLIFNVINDLSNLNLTSSIQNSNEVLRFLDSMAEAIIKSPMNKSSVSFNGSTIGFGLLAVPKSHQAPVHAFVRNSDNMVSVSFSEDVDENRTHFLENFQLPAEIFVAADDSSLNHVYSYSFKNSDLFLSSNDTCNKINGNKMVAVDGSVLAITVYNKTVKDLKEPVQFTMKVSKKNNKALCAYWKTEDNYLLNRWSTSGCNTTKNIIDGDHRYVTCQCDHLTSFGVLLNVYGDTFEMVASFELSLVSQTGCYISISALLISLVALSFLSEVRRSQANKILINLCLSLFFLMATFLGGIEYTESHEICSTVSVLLHTFILSTFAWMCVEAVSLYRKAVRTFKSRGEGSKFFKMSFAIAWFGPLLIALVSKFVSKQHLQPNDNKKHCMITGRVFTYALLLPVSILLGVNILLFIPILRKVQGHITTRSSFKKIPKPKRMKRRARVTFSCTVLLGVTWAFAYLSIGKAGYLFQWLFTVTNSFQGLFILIFHVLLNDRVMKSWRAFFKNRSSKDTSSTISLHAYRNDTKPIWSH